MKILFINGSPRKNGNTSLILKMYCSSFRDLMNVEQSQMEFISLAEQRIESCRGCRVCMKMSEDNCPCKDDVNHIEIKIKEADVIIVGSPVYVEDISGLLKMWIDRMAYRCHRPFLNGKPVVLFTTSGEKASKHAITTLRHVFLSWVRLLFLAEIFQWAHEWIPKLPNTNSSL